MNTIYGAASGESSSFNQIDVSRGQIQSSQTEEVGQGCGSKTGLETLNSLPAGFDPIFNPKANSNFVNDNSHIKINPMKLSKGFDSGIMNKKTTTEATETSSFSALSRDKSSGT